MRCKICGGSVDEILFFYPRANPVPGNFIAYRHSGNWEFCPTHREIVFRSEVVE